LFTVSSVLKLPPPAERIPERSPCVQDASWLISLCGNDRRLIALARHLHNVHEIVTVGEFDAAGWEVVNTFPRRIPRKKLREFFQALGKKREGVSPLRPLDGATIIPFIAAHA
jgi:hypothetical protein